MSRTRDRGAADPTADAAGDSTSDVRVALLAFFDAHKRDLPWRRTRDPYAIWVSEIMLQQTRVETVIPYYGTFLAQFPTVLALAEADEDLVLSRWSGLGYYRRARMLHAAAKVIASAHAGNVPTASVALLALPGIGRYTAGAIASIAADERVAVVDGNVVRVLARVFGIAHEVGPQDAAVWARATALADAPRPGDVNQAMMELGATLCLPTNPRCGQCPVRVYCTAFAEDRVASLPKLAKKSAAPVKKLVALVTEKDGAVLLARRKSDGLFGGLWEPPMIERPRRAAEIAPAFAALLGRAVTFEGRARTVRHVLTHRDLRVRVQRGAVARGALRPAAPYEDVRWVTALEMGALGVSTLCKKTLRAAGVGLDAVESPRGAPSAEKETQLRKTR